MADSAILQSNNYLEKYLADYSFATYHLWTKPSGGSGWNSYILGKKCIAEFGEDQSVRAVVNGIGHRFRFGFADGIRRKLGIAPNLCWEFIPDVAEGPVFSDDFSTDFGTPDYDTSKWQAYQTATVTIVSGALRVVSSSSGGLKSQTTFDFTNKSVSMKMPVIQSNGAAASGFLLSTSDSFSNYFSIDEYNGSLRAVRDGNQIATRAYNATNDLYKRIRFVGSTVYFDVSPDGTTWTNWTSSAFSSAITALYLYLRPYSAGGPYTFEYDDVKIVAPASTKKYIVTENGNTVFTSSRTPAANNELRIRIYDDGGGNYKARYYWRENDASAEELEYTTSIGSTELKSYFPIFYKGEIFDNGGVIKNLQLEVSLPAPKLLDTFSYFTAKAKEVFTFPLIFKLGNIPGAEGSGIGYWMLDFPKRISAIGKIVETHIAASGTISRIDIITPGLPVSKSAEFDVHINGVSILSSNLVIDNTNGTAFSVVNVSVDLGDLVEVFCDTITASTTLEKLSSIRITMEED